MALHHPDKERFPDWVLDVGNNLFHRCLTIMQRMKPLPDRLMRINNMFVAIGYILSQKMREADENERDKI